MKCIVGSNVELMIT